MRAKPRALSTIALLATLVAALVVPASIAAPAATAAAKPAGAAWVLRDTTVNPDAAAPPIEFEGLDVTPGHAAFTWSSSDRAFAAHYDATYTAPPAQLEPDRTYGVNVTFSGAITADRAPLFTGAGVVVVVNRTWERAIGIQQSCHVAGTNDPTLTCDAPATKSGTLRFAAPGSAKSGDAFDVTVGVTNCGACGVRYHYERATAAGSPSRTVGRARLPVIVVPGVAGTALSSRTAEASSEVWPDAKLAGRDGLQLEDDGVTPTTDAEIRTGDILRGGSLRHFSNTYGPLIASLKKQGYREGTDLFTFPYDWRLDNSLHFSDLDTAVQSALAKSGADHVVLLAHGTGGLIAREYVLSNPFRAKTVDSIITLGTPYFGSPKAFYAFMQGDTFGNPNVSQDLMKVLVQHFPAEYQLLPQFPFVRDETSGAMIPLFLTYLTQYPGVQWLSPEDRYVQSSETWTLVPRLVDGALQFNARGGTPEEPAPSPVRQYVVIGDGLRTLTGYVAHDDPSSSITTAGGRHVRLEPEFGDGDGTVPLQGLQLNGATATYYLRSTATDSTAHGDLPASKRVQRIVGGILAGHPPQSAGYGSGPGVLRTLATVDLAIS